MYKHVQNNHNHRPLHANGVAVASAETNQTLPLVSRCTSHIHVNMRCINPISSLRTRPHVIAALACSCALSAALVCTYATTQLYAQQQQPPTLAQNTSEQTQAQYKLYPTPHSYTTTKDVVSLPSYAHVYAEKGIDTDTYNRLKEALSQQQMDIVDDKQSASLMQTPAEIYMGIHGSGDKADTLYNTLVKQGAITDGGMWNNIDPYTLCVLPATSTTPVRIVILGKDSDSAYYGATTLYHLLSVLPGSTLRKTVINDWADVKTRGFIEGYYGNPWSVQDRINLMKWAGYYKLNAYVYAPKDDPKHNKHWQELYTPEELKRVIEPLAKAGNESKTRFLYALHPFMYDPITSANYDTKVAILKKKFKQTIDHGVRQIAILADDEGNQGADLYTRLLKDMSDWIQGLQKQTAKDGTPLYPGLKDTIVFCPVNYMGYGEGWYKNLPSNIQVINTGGRVWGKIDRNFATSFKNNSSRAPFMWINWPCSDNDKNALHMGGHDNFLGSDLTPGEVEGVVINPMQESEPSKQGMFMTADFTWNLWKSTKHSAQTWDDSFSYIDHNNGRETRSSKAYKLISENMRRMFGGGTTWDNDESQAMQDKLAAYSAAAKASNFTAKQAQEVKDLLAPLEQATIQYAENPGNPYTYNQIKPWIDAWKDLLLSVRENCDAVLAKEENNTSAMLEHAAQGYAAFKAYQSHGFHYIDHTEYARVGKRTVEPFARELNEFAVRMTQEKLNPNKVFTTYVTNRSDTPEGGEAASVLDGNPSTKLIYKSPNKLTSGTYFGVTRNKPFDVTRVTFTQGQGRDFMDAAKLQYFDGKTWKDVEGQTNLGGASVVDVKGLTLKQVYGVRLIATRDNKQDAWPTIADIEINRDDAKKITTTVDLINLQEYQQNKKEYVLDGQQSTLAWLHGRGNPDNIKSGDAVQLNFSSPKTIDKIFVRQGYKPGGSKGDTLQAGVVEYSCDNGKNWKQAGTIGSDNDKTYDIEKAAVTNIRVRSTKDTNAWWVLNDITAHEVVKPKTAAFSNIESPSIVAISSDAKDNVISLSNATQKLEAGDYVGADLGAIRQHVTVTGAPQLPAGVKLMYSENGLAWSEYANKPVTARFVAWRATNSAQITTNNTSISFDVKHAPSTVSSDIGTVNAKALFDGDISTTFKNTQCPKEGQKVVFDLGQERHITSLAYYVPETSLDFIRDAVIEAADSKDAPDSDWHKVLTINGKTKVENVWTGDTAKEAPWLTHDSKNPGNVYTANPKTDDTAKNANDINGTKPLDVHARYLRLRFTSTYDFRWVEFGELLINAGEHPSTYSNADITATDQGTTSLATLLDNDTSTTWKSAKQQGELTYNVSDPKTPQGAAKQGVRITCVGKPSGAQVTAHVYTDDNYVQTTDVTLGYLDNLLNEFSFTQLPKPKPTASKRTARAANGNGGPVVKSITIDWKGAPLELSEITLMDTARAATQDDVTKLSSALDAAQKINTTTWTQGAKDALTREIAVAKRMLEGTATQDSFESQLAQLTAALKNVPQRADTKELSALVTAFNGVKPSYYTKDSYSAYETAIADITTALAAADNLTQERATALKDACAKAYSALTYDTATYERSRLVLDKTKAAYAVEIAGTSKKDATKVATFKAAYNALTKLTDKANPKEIETAIAKLQTAQQALDKDVPVTPTPKPPAPVPVPPVPAPEPGEQGETQEGSASSSWDADDIAEADAARATTAMYRLYNKWTHEHLFTTDKAEYDSLVTAGWTGEGEIDSVATKQGKGVYRLYNPYTHEHHYTAKEDEVEACVKAGWKNEGIKFHSVQNGTVPVYSMYNPYAKKFYHHYTSDPDEITKMVKDGWIKEEIKWYAAPKK